MNGESQQNDYGHGNWTLPDAIPGRERIRFLGASHEQNLIQVGLARLAVILGFGAFVGLQTFTTATGFSCISATAEE